MGQYWKLVALVWVPFVSIFVFAAPALVRRVGDSYPHIVFHLAAVTLLVLATLLARRMRAVAPARAQRVLLGMLLVSIPAAVLGNVMEMVAAVGRLATDGWESMRTPDLFGEGGGLHFLGSNLTIPAMMLSMLLTLVLTAVAGLQARRPEAVR